MVIYKDEILAVYKKAPGEDSERLNLPDEIKGYNALTRLDKPVGGMLLLSSPGKGGKVKDIESSKTYLAVVTGAFESESGTMTDLLFHDRRNNKTYPVKRMRNGVKEATLDYEVIAYDNARDMSLVRIKLGTGRTHQIRVQFASRKHPLFGDGKYGSRYKGLPALCCNHLEFIHPIKNSPMAFDIQPEGEPWSYFDL